MKGNDKLIEMLNSFLKDELTAINQYMVHSEMCANWGYEKLHQVTEKRAIDEMKHAERLIGRILFLDGRPTVSKLNDIHIGPEVAEQIKNDLADEASAVEAYNKGIEIAAGASDNGTLELLETILKDEEEHLDKLEAHIGQVEQIGMQNFLSEQLGE